ncbi:MAG TPA: hypothetical protein PKK33_10555 [Candidatus Cloacimonadota bacterium]|nr:hypothetical protein [Candidatus Cloacimonadota bacterium]
MRIYQLVLLLISILTCIGCSKKDSDQGCIENFLGQFSLSQTEKIVPEYRINDSIEFIQESNNNRLWFTCKFQVSDYYTHSDNEPDSNGNINCLGNYYKTETYITQFNDRPTNWIRIQVNKASPYDTTFKVNGFRISISIPGDSIYMFEGEYSFTEDSLFSYPNLFGASVDGVYDTITIGGQLYHKVYHLKGYQHLFIPERITDVLYSTSCGILSFSTNKSSVWYKKNRTILH